MKANKILMACALSILAVLAGCTSASPKATFDFDFNQPSLRQLARSKPIKPIKLIEITRYDTWHRFKPAVYVAMVVGHDAPQKVDWLDGSERTRLLPSRSLLLFRVNNGKTKLIWKSGPHYYISLYIGEPASHFYSVAKQDPARPAYFQDLNGNGLPDLAYDLSHGGGNGLGTSRIGIVELTSNGGAKDITPRTNFVPSDFRDIDEDGKMEIIAQGFHEADFGARMRLNSPYEQRIYQWQGDAYREASTKFTNYFDKEIAKWEKKIKATYGRPFESEWMTPMLVQIFFDYEATARRDEGWQQVRSLGDLNNWDLKKTPASDIESYRRVLNRLRKRVN